MTTMKVRTADGLDVAYDVTGTGPGLILLHGGGQSRRVWHETGFVTRLRERFTVIAVDTRGHGDSSRPTEADAYAIGRLAGDVLTVADATAMDTVAVWGYSLGGNIARYLPAHSPRVSRTVIIGVGFGPAAPDRFRDYARNISDKRAPVIAASRDGTLNVGTLSAQDQALWHTGRIPATVAQLIAIASWPPIEPRDLPSPTLWVVGSANAEAMASVDEYRDQLVETHVALHIVPGLTHAEELTHVDQLLAPMLQFTLAQNR